VLPRRVADVKIPRPEGAVKLRAAPTLYADGSGCPASGRAVNLRNYKAITLKTPLRALRHFRPRAHHTARLAPRSPRPHARQFPICSQNGANRAGGATFECSTSYPLGVLGPDSLQTPHRLWCVTSAPRKSTLSIGRCRRTFQTHDADPDIPILKQAKAEYEKLKWAAEVRSLVTFVESAAIVFLPASVLIELVIFAKAPSDAAFTPSPQYARQRRQEPAPFHLPNAENRTAASFPLLN